MSFFGGRRNPQPEPTPEPHQDRAASSYSAPSPTNPTRETRETPIPPAQPIGFETVLVGVSGGIDSSLTAAIACVATGSPGFIRRASSNALSDSSNLRAA